MDEHRDIDVKAETLSPSSLKLYETQFFGFTPRNCMLRIYVAFESSLGNALLSGENMCVKEHSKGRSDEANELLRCQVRECRRELQRVLLDRFNKLYKRMEALLVLRCFTVPPNVLLPKDQVHREQLNDMQVGEEEEYLRSSINKPLFNSCTHSISVVCLCVLYLDPPLFRVSGVFQKEGATNPGSIPELSVGLP